MPRDFILPDLGEGIHEAQVVRVLVQEGQDIQEDQPLAEVETDKAAVEIPSPFSGKVQKVHIKEGQTINVGAPLVTFGDGEGPAEAPPKAGKPRPEEAAPAKAKKAQLPEAEEAAPPKARQEPPPEAEEEEAVPSKPAAAPPSDRRPPAPAAPPARAARAPEPTARAAAPPARAEEPAAHRTTAPAAPAVRKLAREMGVDIDSLEGTGPGGRVTQQDVEAAAAAPQRGAPAPTARAPATPGLPAPAPQRPPAAPAGVAATDQWGATRRVALSQIRKTIAAQMVRSVSSIPHVTHHDEADITELDRLRRGYFREDDPSTKLTLMPFVIRALCAALRQHPILNASFDGEANEIVYKEYFNIGIAVDTPRGLIVPVIRDADRLGITELAGALAVIAEKVRTSQFTIDELRGGTFTITNYGAIGGMFGTPIINYPEVAILGMGRAQERVVAHDGKMEVRTILPLSVSFDHRATDGAEVARFVNDFAALLQNPARLLL